MYRNKIIVFEGIEGSGKTSHLNFVSNYLKRKKIPHLKLREPGGTRNSEKIRKLILNNKSNFNKNTDLLLYLSARSENIEYIEKNRKKKLILIDRFTDSTIAYQHYGLGVDLSLIKKINNYILKKVNVDFTFLNTVNIRNMSIRLKNRKKLNRYDKFSLRFYKKVQNGFLKIAKKNKNKYLIIDSNLNIEINKKIIIDKIKKLIK